MCRSVDELSEKLDAIIKRIIKNDNQYSLDEIYKILEAEGIRTKRYEPGTSIKDYLDILVSYGILDKYNGKYTSSENIEDELLEFAI